jgi:hypothetical protein
MEEHVAFEEQKAPVKKSGHWLWHILTSLVVIAGIVLTVIFLPSKPTPGGSQEPTEDPEDALYVRTTLEDGLMYWPDFYHPYRNNYFGVPVRFEIPEDYWGNTEITYEVHSDVCSFWKSTSEGRDIFGNTYNTVGMKLFYADPTDIAPLEHGLGLYIDAVIRADDAPVGYAVIELGYDDGFFFTVRTEVVVFPLLDGEFQPVTEAYIQKCIARAEEERTTGYSIEEVIKKRDEYWASLEGN